MKDTETFKDGETESHIEIELPTIAQYNDQDRFT